MLCMIQSQNIYIYLVATHTPQLDDPIFFIWGQETSIEINLDSRIDR